ncbi:hypothetical protein BOX15_Mlig014125g1, partial [Macrostomum lignano]
PVVSNSSGKLSAGAASLSGENSTTPKSSAGQCRCCLVSRGPEPALGKTGVYRLCGGGDTRALSIGRRPDANLILRHGSASRQQLALVPVVRHAGTPPDQLTGWDWRAVDCGSANGTFVNGRRAPVDIGGANSAPPLRCGDRITVGPPRESVLWLEFVAADCPLHRPSAVADCSASFAASSRKRSSPATARNDAGNGDAESCAATSPKRKASDTNVPSGPADTAADKDAEVAAMRRELEALRDQLAEKDRALAEQERQMRKRLADEVEALEADRLAVMAGLEAEMRKEMADRDAEHEALLQRERARLEQALRDKEAKQAVLEGELSKARDAAASSGGVTPEARADIMRSLAEVLETELNCPICCDLLVDAATMPCSHTFCRYCIEEWLRRKNECPQCRAPGNGSLSRALVVDSYVDRMVAELAPERRAERDARVAEQREKLDKLQGRKRPRPGQQSQTQQQQQQQQRQQQAASTSRQQRQPPAAAGPSGRRGAAAATAIVLDSSDSDSDSDAEYNGGSSTDSSESMDGNPRAYYGGYGRCYNCGRRGHWANGCPF